MRIYSAPWLATTAMALLACGVAAGIDARQPMPNFRATTLDGQKYTNDSVKGKVVLLQFWATWCQPAKTDMATANIPSRHGPREGRSAT